MTSPPIPPNFSHRIWTIHRNDLIEQWGGQFPPSPPRGAATADYHPAFSLEAPMFTAANVAKITLTKLMKEYANKIFLFCINSEFVISLCL